MEKSKEFVINNTKGLEIAKVTKKILEELDMKKDYKGYQLWIEAVKYMLAERSKNNLLIMKEVYVDLGKKYKLKGTQIERALRDARSTIKKDMQLYFKTKHRITNSLFLALLCNKVEEQIKI